MKYSYWFAIFSAVISVSSVSAKVDNGYYLGMSLAADAARVDYSDSIPTNFYVPLLGVAAGPSAGWEWVWSTPKRNQWHKKLRVEVGINQSSADDEISGSTAVLFRSLRLKNDRYVSFIPALVKGRQEYYMRLGGIRTQLTNVETHDTPNRQAPTFSHDKTGWQIGVGSGHYITPHWQWLVELNQSFYPEVSKNNGTNTFKYGLQRTQYRLSLQWHELAADYGLAAEKIPDGWNWDVGLGYDLLSTELNFNLLAGTRERALSHDGYAVSLGVGYDQLLTHHFSLGGHAEVVHTNSSVAYDNGNQNSDFKYSHDAAVALTLRPGWRMDTGQAFFAEIGVARLHIKKTGSVSPVTFAGPNFNRWQQAGVLGLGYTSMINSKNAVTLHLKYYDTKRFRSHHTNANNIFNTAYVGPQLAVEWVRFKSFE
jgi:hypothetical protein